MSTSKKWWETDTYDDDTPVPSAFFHHAGPLGPALVKLWDNGKTDEGWGLRSQSGGPTFMPTYANRGFDSRRVLYGYEQGHWAFAFVMRSVSLVAIDVDPKNDGPAHLKKLGMLPPTLAETSRSGNGLHMFYIVDDVWDSRVGFAKLGDRIGLEQGIDVRATGCVYHYPQQRWNRRPVVPLPDHLYDMLQHRKAKALAATQRVIAARQSGDELEVLMLEAELKTDLAKPIPGGRRNNTLFAIGTKMKELGVSGWDDLIRARAEEVGLEAAETEKLVANIERYGVTPATP